MCGIMFDRKMERILAKEAREREKSEVNMQDLMMGGANRMRGLVTGTVKALGAIRQRERVQKRGLYIYR